MCNFRHKMLKENLKASLERSLSTEVITKTLVWVSHEKVKRAPLMDPIMEHRI